MPPAEDATSFGVVEDESSVGTSPSSGGHPSSEESRRRGGGSTFRGGKPSAPSKHIITKAFGSLGDGWMAFFALCAFSMLFFQVLHHRQQLDIYRTARMETEPIMLDRTYGQILLDRTLGLELKLDRLDTLEKRVGEVESQFKVNPSARNMGESQDPDENELVRPTQLLELEQKVESLVRAVKQQQDKGIEMETQLAEELSPHETKIREELQSLNETIVGALETLIHGVEQLHQSMETQMDEGQNHTASLNAQIQTLEDSMTKSKEQPHEQCNQPYKILDRADRNVNFVDDYAGYWDHPHRKTSPDWQGNGWYRFMGKAGTQMPEFPPPSRRHCGSYYPAWLGGSHPAVSDGIVKRQVCERGPSNTCEYHGTIQVVNCGAFFLYNLEARFRRYCGV